MHPEKLARIILVQRFHIIITCRVDSDRKKTHILDKLDRDLVA